MDLVGEDAATAPGAGRGARVARRGDHRRRGQRQRDGRAEEEGLALVDQTRHDGHVRVGGAGERHEGEGGQQQESLHGVSFVLGCVLCRSAFHLGAFIANHDRPGHSTVNDAGSHAHARRRVSLSFSYYPLFCFVGTAPWLPLFEVDAITPFTFIFVFCPVVGFY